MTYGRKDYDARFTVPGIRVAYAARPRYSGLTMSQVKAMKPDPKRDYSGDPASATSKTEWVGVLRVQPAGGPVGLGMISTVRCSRSAHAVKPTRQHGPKTPGKKQGATGARKGPGNRAFHGDRIGIAMRNGRMAIQAYKAVTRLWHDGGYARARLELKDLYPQMMERLGRFEQASKGWNKRPH